MSTLESFVKTPDAIKKIRIAAQLAAQVLVMVEPHVKPGVTTDELNTLCHDYMVNELGTVPAPLNYRGYPKSICTSINHVICHGIPNDKKLPTLTELPVFLSLIAFLKEDDLSIPNDKNVDPLIPAKLDILDFGF